MECHVRLPLAINDRSDDLPYHRFIVGLMIVGAPTALIIDDEDAVRSSLKMIFEYEGYEVAEAAIAAAHVYGELEPEAREAWLEALAEELGGLADELEIVAVAHAGEDAARG